MSQSKEHIKAFISSPGGLKTERDLICSVISQFNRQASSTYGCYIDIVRWEDDVYPSASQNGPQSEINNQIGYTYELFIGLMWNRFGTPTLHANSGTEEEFDLAYERFKNGDNIKILFYFKIDDVSVKPKSKQEKNVLKFKEKLRKLGVLYNEYHSNNTHKFLDDLRIHIQKAAEDILNSNFNNSKRLEIINSMYLEAGAQVAVVGQLQSDINKCITLYSFIHHAFVDEANLANKFYLRGRNTSSQDIEYLFFTAEASVPTPSSNMNILGKDLISDSQLLVHCSGKDTDNVKKLILFFAKPLKPGEDFEIQLSYSLLDTMFLEKEDFISSGQIYEKNIERFEFKIEFKNRIPKIVKISYYDWNQLAIKSVYVSGRGLNGSCFTYELDGKKHKLLSNLNLIASFDRP